MLGPVYLARYCYMLPKAASGWIIIYLTFYKCIPSAGPMGWYLDNHFTIFHELLNKEITIIKDALQYVNVNPTTLMTETV